METTILDQRPSAPEVFNFNKDLLTGDAYSGGGARAPEALNFNEDLLTGDAHSGAEALCSRSSGFQ